MSYIITLDYPLLLKPLGSLQVHFISTDNIGACSHMITHPVLFYASVWSMLQSCLSCLILRYDSKKTSSHLYKPWRVISSSSYVLWLIDRIWIQTFKNIFIDLMWHVCVGIFVFSLLTGLKWVEASDVRPLPTKSDQITSTQSWRNTSMEC